MGHCLLLPTTAAGITVLFLTPLNQTDFAEKTIAVLRRLRQAQKGRVSLEPGVVIVCDDGQLVWFFCEMFLPHG